VLLLRYEQGIVAIVEVEETADTDDRRSALVLAVIISAVAEVAMKSLMKCERQSRRILLLP
jgi:hypothetical protein